MCIKEPCSEELLTAFHPPETDADQVEHQWKVFPKMCHYVYMHINVP